MLEWIQILAPSRALVLFRWSQVSTQNGQFRLWMEALPYLSNSKSKPFQGKKKNLKIATQRIFLILLKIKIITKRIFILIFKTLKNKNSVQKTNSLFHSQIYPKYHCTCNTWNLTYKPQIFTSQKHNTKHKMEKFALTLNLDCCSIKPLQSKHTEF